MNTLITTINRLATKQAMLCVAAMFSLSALGSAQFSAAQRLDTNSLPGASESDGIAIASFGNTIHAAWFEQDPITGRDIYYARSLDAGASWLPPVRIDQAPGLSDQEFPVLLVEAQTVVLAWLDDRGLPLVQDVYARTSHDGGSSFGVEMAVTGFLTSDGFDADNLVGAISLPYVHLCFEDNRNATDIGLLNEDAIVVSSSDGGASFGIPVVANHPLFGPGSGDVDSPGIVASGATVHVTWVDRRNGVADKVFINTSHDGGLTFAVLDTRLDSTVALNADANNPRIALSGSALIVTWRDNQLNPLSTAKKLYLNSSVDGGTTFSGQVRVDSAGLPANTKSGKIAFSGDDFVIGWIDDRNDPLGVQDDVFIRTGTLSGGVLTLGLEQRLEQTIPGTSDNGGLKLRYLGPMIYVQYQDSRNDLLNLNDGLYLRASKNHGASFLPEILLTPALTGAQDVEGNEFVVTPFLQVVSVWGDDRNGTGLLPPNDVFSSSGAVFPIILTPGHATRVNPPLGSLPPQ